ncbi:MAG: hypothetical protein U0931_10840 [Vulcanimicrobiota bacterium]
MGKKNKKPKAVEGLALQAVQEHFSEHSFTQLVSFHRAFPGTARADLQLALAKLLAGARLLGVCSGSLKWLWTKPAVTEEKSFL